MVKRINSDSEEKLQVEKSAVFRIGKINIVYCYVMSLLYLCAFVTLNKRLHTYLLTYFKHYENFDRQLTYKMLIGLLVLGLFS